MNLTDLIKPGAVRFQHEIATESSEIVTLKQSVMAARNREQMRDYIWRWRWFQRYGFAPPIAFDLDRRGV